MSCESKKIYNFSLILVGLLAGAIEYTDCISAKK